jgi:hypothetical protein
MREGISSQINHSLQRLIMTDNERLVGLLDMSSDFPQRTLQAVVTSRQLYIE